MQRTDTPTEKLKNRSCELIEEIQDEKAIERIYWALVAIRYPRQPEPAAKQQDSGFQDVHFSTGALDRSYEGMLADEIQGLVREMRDRQQWGVIRLLHWVVTEAASLSTPGRYIAGLLHSCQTLGPRELSLLSTAAASMQNAE